MSTINRFTSRALVDKMRERNSLLTKADAELAVSRVFDAVDGLLVTAGDQVRIAGFGTFKKKFVPGKAMRNPRTGEPIQTADSEKITFKPAKAS